MRAGSRASEAEKYWKSVLGTMADNLVLAMVVLREQYGFGEKRLTEFVNAVAEKVPKFDDMEKDGVLDIKTHWERAAYDAQISTIIKENARRVLPPDVFGLIYGVEYTPNKVAIAARRRKEKQEREAQTLSLSQAAMMQEQLQAAKGWAMDNKGYRAAFGKEGAHGLAENR